MSLLIKALDSAEKNKQAVKRKEQMRDRVADAALSLELAPVAGKQTAESKQTAEEYSTEKSEAKSEFGLAANAFVDNGLSLEDEAGLGASTIVVSQYAKPKQDITKANDKDEALKDNLQESLQAAKPKNNASLPMAAMPGLQIQASQATDANQKAAAKVFLANQPVKTVSSKYALAILGVAGALMIWLGLQGYTYMRSLAAQDAVVVKPAMPIPPQMAVATPGELAALPKDTQVASVSTNETAVNGNQDKNTNNQASSNQTPAPNNKVVEKANADEAANQTESSPNMFVAENEAPKKSRTKKLKNSGDESLIDSEASLQNTSKHAPLRLISKAPAAGVDPTLLSAYQAFNRGEYAAAQQQYRQVLQRDVRNVDALLGMAAIAQRQGRDADAAGWYQKVLEIEPRNTIAQSAIISPQANADVVGTESRIKNMLAQQPEAANLHAALGNLYAEQNQWASAQDAYFNASRFAPNSADYAFNLAISLDQLGKSNLALKQYQRALDLLNTSGASSPDRTQLEARIKALQ